MSIGLKQRLLNQSTNLASVVCIFGKGALLAVEDHAERWAFGINFLLKMSSIFFIVPFTLTIDQDGLRTLQAGTTSRRFMTWLCNIAGGLRVGFFLLITLDRNFKWIHAGQLTVDASFFLVWFLYAFGAQAAHFALLWQTDDVVFLCNAASRLNKGFASMLNKLSFCTA